jgi:hypothetical protein
LLTKTSQAGTLESQSFVFRSCCHTTQTSDSDNCCLILSFSSPGNISIILATVLAAQEVCKVAKTKFQVSAARRASLKVSKSLISQIIITSGACLKAYLSQLSKF